MATDTDIRDIKKKLRTIENAVIRKGSQVELKKVFA